MSTDIATTNNYFLQVAQETQASELGGRLLKFVKGRFHVGDDEVPAGGEYIAHVNKLMRGYVKFFGGKLVEQRLGKVADGFGLPKRDELGDTDQTAWERDTSGSPRDPWCLQYYLPIENAESGEVLIFVTSSSGGRGAIGNLCNLFARNTDHGLPVIKLSSSSYRHRTFGRIDTPDFPVLRWQGGTMVDSADEDGMMQVISPGDEMNDAIPF
jgi:hypothetical protein